MSNRPALVWLRNDLRLSDNPALHAAIERGNPVILVYIHDEESEGIRPLGSASKWWLHHSLEALHSDIEQLGGTLVLRRGAAAPIIHELVSAHDVEAVFWNRRYGKPREIDATLKKDLREQGVTCESFAGNLLFEPWTIKNGEGNPFRVFTPFWKACLASGPPRFPLPAPSHIANVSGVESDELSSWALLPTSPDWSGGLHAQ